MVNIRRATTADIDALVELRAQMFTSMGRNSDDHTWRSYAAAWFTRKLSSGEAMVVVTEVPDGRLVAAALGEINHDPPSPSNTTGIRGRISNVVTAAPYRRRGYARACVRQLLDWFRAETEVADIDLFATGEGSNMYREFGFEARPYPAMRLRLPARARGSGHTVHQGVS
ncbi:GNAT family N-acetyltransferase [Actinopolyspora mortivallis]|uniref:GNAT family N-acetyltransferase n=1 Tax=Actinopolyspora mortivallis TaxID=33906 RepID=A0A2T0GUB5_ACTMO|nr:GNAT family N-acetyltransferase [Actinopolyspora mortivallis]PRW62684.1 GNAT family N-acetyltransferase [Actinopolyspora mortivallis]